MTITTFDFTGSDGDTLDLVGPFTKLGSGSATAAQIQGSALTRMQGDGPVWGLNTGDDEHFAEMTWYEEAIWLPGGIWRPWVTVTDRNQGIFAGFDATDDWGIYQAGGASPGRLQRKQPSLAARRWLARGRQLVIGDVCRSQ